MKKIINLKKLLKLPKIVIVFILVFISPIFFFSQGNNLVQNPTVNLVNNDFNFEQIAKKINYEKNLNQVKRTVKVGILIEENGAENNINYNNLKIIFQYFSPFSNLVIYRFRTKEQWLEGVEHLSKSGVEIVLHLYKENQTFLNKPLPSYGENVLFGDFLDRWSEKTGILHFFDGSRAVGNEIFSNFAVFAKVNDRFKNNGKILNYTKIFGNSDGVVKSNHFIVPQLKFNYQLNSKVATVDFYSVFLIGAIFSQLSSSFDNYDGLKEMNQRILTTLFLTAEPSENSNLGFNGIHINEGFGIINFKNAFLTLIQENIMSKKYDGNTYVSSPFELQKGQKFATMIFHDKFSKKTIKTFRNPGIGGFFQAFFKNIYNNFNNLFGKNENSKLNDFDISVEIYRGGWTKIIEANSENSPFDKISFRAFEDGQYRIKVTNADFQPEKPSTFFLAWRRYPTELKIQENKI